MDTGSRRTRKTVSKLPEAETLPSPPEAVSQTIPVDGKEYSLIEIRATGDVILDVTFENHKSATRLATGLTGVIRLSPLPTLKNGKAQSVESDTRILYRVRLETLKKTSNYFKLLLGSDRFEEGKKISSIFGSLKAKGIEPAEADAVELPRIAITDDDEATHIAGRDAAFGDLLRILHGADVTSRFTISYLATLSIMADRFDCTPTIGRFVKASKKLPWPQTYGVMTLATEETLRQKILISWLLEDPVKLSAATKELILRGSLRWTASPSGPSVEISKRQYQATWWDLQDGLEAELHYRRSCILATISSLQSHFLALYTSRERQCKLFYDSSAACDSYQLGEMIKFFTHKGLLTLISTLSNDEEYPDMYDGDIENLLTTLRQCPSYQIDKNHGHCGLRARIIPALDYIQAMLVSNIGIDAMGWKNDRPSTSWEEAAERDDNGKEIFRFTRAVAGDTRFRMEGFFAAHKLAKELFTAGQWDWTPEI